MDDAEPTPWTLGGTQNPSTLEAETALSWNGVCSELWDSKIEQKWNKKHCFLRVVHYLWLLKSFCSSSALIPEHWGKGFDGVSHLGLGAPKSLTLCPLSCCGSLC